MADIKVKTADHRLIMLASPLLVSGSKAADIIQVEFDESWDYGEDTERLIQFVRDSEIYTYELHENKATVPQEVLLSPGRFSFAVFAKEGGRIIKTSNYCTVAVLKGPNTDDIILVDWNAFFIELINKLNETFDLDLSDSDSPEKVLQTVSDLENSETVKKYFIELLNSHIGTALDCYASKEQIEFAVSNAVDSIYEQSREFSSLNALVKESFDTYVTDVDTEGIDPKYLAYMAGINDYCQSVIDNLTALYGGE